MSESNIILELYLVRHGESLSNIGQTEGLSDELKNDAPLSPKGERQAELLGKYLSGLKLDCVFSSGLRRALNTANEIIKYQPEDGAKVIEVHKIFTECNTGTECIGRTISQIKEDYPAVIGAVGTDPNEKQVFHGKDDSDEELLRRGKEAIDYILSRFNNGEKVLVTAHAAFNTFMLYAALGLSHEQIFDPAFHNTSITKIVFFKQGEGKFADIHLIYHNAVPHLVDEFEDLKY